ncbi:uncharacterized protein LOC115676169 [Syzygium oleosum]|uniref:uncharacterized protein LOC115676169 n=1 Tax=Syzygium oleosum TaxID=219896 RepID=UPI0024BBB81A|nr:uncharacterized protein LOC115676169 [Syzygium oleosum]
MVMKNAKNGVMWRAKFTKVTEDRHDGRATLVNKGEIRKLCSVVNDEMQTQVMNVPLLRCPIFLSSLSTVVSLSCGIARLSHSLQLLRFPSDRSLASLARFGCFALFRTNRSLVRFGGSLRSFPRSTTRSVDENLECHVDETIVEPIGTQSRKRAAQTSTRQARGKKDKKLSTREELGTQINRLVAAVESRGNATATSQATTNVVGPYKDLIDILDTILEIVEDEMLYYFAISHLKEKIDNRQVFMSLKDDAKGVKYLKYEFGRESGFRR